ncbi:hypothetical protein HUO13_06700 [Saccharopolyspora erythraea]|nr:hypothetical protein [Saccharopolyspora erythraea]QUH00548.1 hypothetical protein HUO13_06700 [Saccharopolyspora erythraea]
MPFRHGGKRPQRGQQRDGQQRREAPQGALADALRRAGFDNGGQRRGR